MRILLASLVLIGGLGAAQAQARVDDGKVIRRGIYELGKVKAIDDPSISTGHRTEATSVKFKEHRQRIEVKDGTVFGLDLMVNGRPRGQRIPVRVIWRYPDPGLRNPDSGKTKFKDEYNDTVTLGTESTYYWSVGAEWQRVEGTWTFELWYRDRQLLKQNFDVVRE